MKQRATAIAIATLMVAAGLSIAPSVQAGHDNCHGSDFDIVQGESNAKIRTLDPDESMVGTTDVQAGSPQDLFIELEDEPRKLNWTVYTEDSLGNCVEEDSGQITSTSSDPQPRTTLDDPQTGDQTYWVEYVNAGSQQLKFSNWYEL